MNVFFLDIASSTGTLACSTEEHVVAHRAIDHRIGDQELLPLLEDALREAGWFYKDLTHLACVVGPGGFTSLRVGVSCINALSWALKVPVSGVHLSDLYAARVDAVCHPELVEGRHTGDAVSMVRRAHHDTFLWLHSTKRTELFVRGFGGFVTEWPQPTHVTMDCLLDALCSPITYVGELLPEHRAAIDGAGAEALSLRPVSDILPRFLASRAYREQILQPWYGRGW